MEPQPYLPHHQNPSQIHEESSSTTNSGGKSSFLCRQSSTRWIPTSDQIRILKDLYYNSGIRSPSAEQIQRISAKLRQYGKIEGKNVFYWFQNHKARERQKKRFSVDVAAHNNKYTSTTYNGFSSSSSATSPPSFMGIGQVGAAGYGASYMEKGFRDCSISGARGNEGCMINSFSWTGSTTEQSPSLFPHFETELKLGGGGKDIETLQLFPMHDQEGYEEEEEEEDQLHRHGNGYCISGNNSVDNYIHGWFLGEQGPVGGGSFATTSLELSLGSSFPGAGHRA